MAVGGVWKVAGAGMAGGEGFSVRICGPPGEEGLEGRHEVVRGLEVQEIDAQAAEVLRPFFTVQVHDVGVGFPDVLAGEVQEHAFAGFRVFQDDAPGVRKVQLHRVRDADGDEVVLEVELSQGGLVVLAPEVAEHDDHGCLFLGKDELPGYLRDALIRPVVFTGYDFTDDAAGSA